jgi:hypothetical protein
MGTRLADLQQLRVVLLDSLEAVDADKRAPLAAQLRATLSEIEALESQGSKAGDPVDDLAARRAARGASATSRTRRAGA